MRTQPGCKNPGNTISTNGIWMISPETMAIASACSIKSIESAPIDSLSFYIRVHTAYLIAYTLKMLGYALRVRGIGFRSFELIN